ncbi:MarR family winged helix-turn-helix transcriptional regulator [Shewanella sp. SW32]|uniref:MarR family winged helix-turn-helix transcriptional regulator n=1 Tax=unclassified Shewanella TaxID=196818 RepID=UPI0021DB0A63|nr:MULTISPECIES: MarR family winged helix-turn-helix transcriptional regulator [unclassified Shewanella]MCU7961749.1 MarR family winged helix-turn-helix transcriptional regulator [Shewanella sp. SW32]MCU7970230.1 MarR family winged helix-turn-helix transcriptional regulator [Shewanella sp. SW29]
MSSLSLSETLHRLVHAYKKQLRSDIAAQEIDLPVTHIRALKGVCRNPESTAQSIALRMQRDKAQITRVLNELQQSGLITKIDNPKDGRSQLLRPTAEGEKIMTQINASERKTVARMTQALSSDEVDTFIKLANRISKSVDDAAAKSETDCLTQKRPSSKPKDTAGNGAIELRLTAEHAIGENHNE